MNNLQNQKQQRRLIDIVFSSPRRMRTGLRRAEDKQESIPPMAMVNEDRKEDLPLSSGRKPELGPAEENQERIPPKMTQWKHGTPERAGEKQEKDFIDLPFATPKTSRKRRFGQDEDKEQKQNPELKTPMMKGAETNLIDLLIPIPNTPRKRRSGQAEDKEQKAAGGPYNVELEGNKYTVNFNCVEDMDINIQIRHNLPPKVTTTVPKEDEEMVAAAKILMELKNGVHSKEG